MSNIPEELLYTKEHLWIKVEGTIATMGITDFAQEQLGDILFVDLPRIDSEVVADEVFTEVESSNDSLEFPSPVTGKVIASNESLVDEPQGINENPYENWIVKIELSDLSELDELLSETDYEASIEE
ncbi:Glycine cleavage system H protein [Lachnospiraceae bacterium TWA4]|nr:Glycine cleavage system H protein [Lachnospiraceae bacterium TWA4]